MQQVFDHDSWKAMWDWLSKNPRARVGEWPGWKKNGGKVFMNSASTVDVNIATAMACACGEDTYACMGPNSRCPLQWETGSCTWLVINVWDTAFAVNDWQTRAYAASRIRDMPLRVEE